MPEETKASAKPDVNKTSKKAVGEEKYSPDQKAAAEQKVVENAAEAVDKQNKFIEEFSGRLITELEAEDHNTRTSILQRIIQRVSSIRAVAANAKLRVSRGAVMAEEKSSMPRMTLPVLAGETPIRNIMAQTDQNKTDVNAGGGKK